MATNKYITSLGGIDFEAQDIGDIIPSAIVQHEFPDRDGALLEHMGKRARVVRIRAFFVNDEYDRHQDLLDLMGVRETYELVHPKYGVLTGFASELSVRHDDRDRCAEIDITFTEDLIGSSEETIVEVMEVESAAQESFLSGISDQLAMLQQDIADGMMAFRNATDLKNFNAELSACVASTEAVLTTVQNPANSILSTIQFATDIPGTLLSALSNTVERYSLLYNNLKSAPARFVQSFRNGMAELRASFGSSPHPARQAVIDMVKKHATICGALRLGMDLAGCYKADEQARQQQKQAENKKSFDMIGNYLNPAPADTIMTVNEIEQSLADCRSEIQLAVTAARNLRELQNMAAALLAHVDLVKVEREKIITVTIENAMPLHLICLKYGLPYQAAERVQALNGFKDPNFVSGDIRIYTN